MLKRYSRLLVAFYVFSDATLGIAAFGLAYLVRFSSGLIPVIKGYPPFAQYVAVLPFIGVLVPLVPVSGALPAAPRRSRVDDFFTVFIGSIVAVVLGIISTLYFQAYYVSPELKDRGAYEVSRVVWGLFLVFNVALTFGSRELVREVLERRWKAGIGLKRILIAGAGDLGRIVAEKILQHRELGYQVVGFVDDRAGGDHLGYRGLPLLGTLADAAEIVQQEHIDHLRRAAARRAREDARSDREHEPRNGGREGRARPRAVPRAARASKISTACPSSTSTTSRSRGSTPSSSARSTSASARPRSCS